jgi:hypothetical protein
MKVAVCFSGHGDRLDVPAFVRQLYMYKNYSQIDMFFSLWDADRNTIESVIRYITEQTLSRYQLYFDWNPHVTDCPLVHTQCHAWCEHYHPVKWYSQYKGVKNADIFRQQHGKDYDLVIRSRLDIALAGDVDFATWDQQLNTTDVIIPRSWNWHRLWNDDGGLLNDQFFVARANTMGRLTQMVDRIDEYIDQGCRFHGESLMWWNITKGCSYTYQFGDFDTVLRGRIETN